MAHDIYGHVLQDGHCEVHPTVAEPYPCFVCRQQSGSPLAAAMRHEVENLAARWDNQPPGEQITYADAAAQLRGAFGL